MGKWLRPRRTVRRTLVLDKSDVSGEPTKTSIQAANLRARGRRRANPAQFAAHTRIHDSTLPDAPSDEMGATDPAVGVRDYVDRPERFPDTQASVWAQTLAQEPFQCAVQLLWDLRNSRARRPGHTRCIDSAYCDAPPEPLSIVASWPSDR